MAKFIASCVYEAGFDAGVAIASEHDWHCLYYPYLDEYPAGIRGIDAACDVYERGWKDGYTGQVFNPPENE